MNTMDAILEVLLAIDEQRQREDREPAEGKELEASNIIASLCQFRRDYLMPNLAHTGRTMYHEIKLTTGN